MYKLVSWVDEQGDEQQTSLPAEYHICSGCRGTGMSSAYLGAFTSSEWAEQDEDFKRDYMAGLYDRPCEVADCEGGKILEVVPELCVSEEQKRALRAMEEKIQGDREERAMLRAEMGGW